MEAYISTVVSSSWASLSPTYAADTNTYAAPRKRYARDYVQVTREGECFTH